MSQSLDLSGEQHEYNHLDSFAQSSATTSDKSEIDSETDGETSGESMPKMTDGDAIAIAGLGIEQVSRYVESSLDAPIVIDEKHKEELATKGAALVKKYMPSGEMPAWLLAFKAEIEFGLALGACAFSVYQQKVAYDNSLIEAKQAVKNGN